VHYGPPDGFGFDMIDDIIPVQVIIFYGFSICILIFDISYLIRFVKKMNLGL
jgi:hypothetical protein